MRVRAVWLGIALCVGACGGSGAGGDAGVGVDAPDMMVDSANTDVAPSGDVADPDLDADTSTADTSTADTSTADISSADSQVGSDTGSCSTSQDCVASDHCAGGLCVADVCVAGQSVCDGLDVLTCSADGGAQSLKETCPFVCDGGACTVPVAAITLSPLGVDVLAVGQTVALVATAYDPDGLVIPAAPIAWKSTLPEVLAVSDGGVLTALRVGGGGGSYTGAPDGSLEVTASAGGATAKLTLQVVRVLNKATSLSFVLAPVSDDEASPGRDHYDGLYPVVLGSAGACSPYDNVNFLWDGVTTCEYPVADGRLFVGSTLNLQLRVEAQWGPFGQGWITYPEVGVLAAKQAPRPMITSLVSSNPGVATVEAGVLTAVAPGVTQVTASIGPIGASFRLVVYDERGYDPMADFEPGVTTEAGHLALFSSSTGTAIDGTHDVMRYVDLQTMTNLDFRSSRHGPQGVRLVESKAGGVLEKYPGFGCGAVRGAGNTVWLLNGWTAVPFDLESATQLAGGHKVMFRADGDGAATGARAVCSGVYLELGGQHYLIGFDREPTTFAVFWANVTELDGTSVATADVLATGVAQPLFQQVPATPMWSPTLVTRDGAAMLAFVEQTHGAASTSPNVVHFASLDTDVGGGLQITPNPALDIGAAPTPNDPLTLADAPALIVGHVGTHPYLFVGAADGVTVMDGETFEVLDYSATGDTDPSVRALDTRRFGQNIKAFALSPDGSRLYFAPERSQTPATPYFNTLVEFADSKSTKMTVKRIGVIDLSGDQSPTPRLMVNPATDFYECFLTAGCDDDLEYQFGYDTNLLAMKQWFHNQYGSDLIPVQAMNIRQLTVSDHSLVLIGNDNNDGVGTALGNLSDVAFVNLATGHMPVFRGWRGSPQTIQGFSDPFGFRVGEGDVELGDARVKNAAVLYVAGQPPEERGGDGVLHGPDPALPHAGSYANAPAPVTEPGRVLLLSSSHAAAVDGTLDVVRQLDLSQPGFAETDFTSDLDGAQGQSLEVESPWQHGCGAIMGPLDLVTLFNGDSAIIYDPSANTVSDQYHRVVFDPTASGNVRVCAGAWADVGGDLVLYGVDTGEKPAAPLYRASLAALALGSVTATAVADPFLTPLPSAPDYELRFVAAHVYDARLYLVEPNDPWNGYRNTVHVATIGAAGALSFDARPSATEQGLVLGGARDLVAGWTEAGDPGSLLFASGDRRWLVVGNRTSITVFDVTDPDAPTRENYNTDLGDLVQDDVDTAWYGRDIQGFALAPDGARLYALPRAKSAALPHATFDVPLGPGVTIQQSADRFRLVVLDLTGARPELDWTYRGGNGVDLNAYWLKQALIAEGVSPGALPPVFPYFRAQFAASNASLFLVGNDHSDGVGTALANLVDVATYDVATGVSHLWRDYEYQGLSNASAPWGYDLGVDPLTQLDDENLLEGSTNRVAKSAALLFWP